ncbi:MAG: hypothetical protein J6S63_07510 [Atopobiaceae bacterium]|nr:hypothetical protein [Atopobiaceae bacterium]
MEDWYDDQSEQDLYDGYEPQDVVDEDEAEVGSALARAGSTAVSAASGAGRSVLSGFSAMREVRYAAKQRSNAQADLRDIQRGLEEDRRILEHRESVVRDYDEIVRVHSAELEKSLAEAEQARTGIDEQRAKSQRIQERLRNMREQHEQSLRPYRNLMESSRGRSDDAAKALANTRRAVRNAEGAVSAAAKRRDQQISAANRAVDNANERLSAVANELQMLSGTNGGDGSADGSTALKLQSELATEQAHLESAQRDVFQVTQESKNVMDQAQEKLWALQRELSAAEKTAAEAKEKATAHKDEYERLYKEAQAKEKAQEDAIKVCETRIKELQKTLDSAQTKAEAEQKVLEEAHEINAHPETTEGLRQRIANEEEDLAAAQADLDELTASERQLRHETRGSRFAFVAVAIIVLVVVILLIWFVALGQPVA